MTASPLEDDAGASETPVDDSDTAAGPDIGDHPTAIMLCLNRNGRGRRDWTAALPGLMGK